MKQIGNIVNYYGGLFIKKKGGRYYWLIENYDTDFSDMSQWDEISGRLYRALENEYV